MATTGVLPEHVQLLVDDAVVAQADSVPYALTWHTDDLKEGTHEVRAAGVKQGFAKWLSDPVTVELDRTPPTLVSRVPASGDLNVDVDAPIQAMLSEPIDPSSLVGGLTLARADGTQLLAALSLSPDGKTLTMTPSVELTAPGSLVATFHGVLDTAGNPLVTPPDAWSWSLPVWQSLPLPAGAPFLRVAPLTSASSHVTYLASQGPGGQAWVYQDEGSGLTQVGSPVGPYVDAASSLLLASGLNGQVWVGLVYYPSLHLYTFQNGTWVPASAPPPGLTSQTASAASASVSMAVSADGSLAVAASQHSTGQGPINVALYDGAAWKLLPSPPSNPGSSAQRVLVTYLPDGTLLVGGQDDESIPFYRYRPQTNDWIAGPGMSGQGAVMVAGPGGPYLRRFRSEDDDSHWKLFHYEGAAWQQICIYCMDNLIFESAAGDLLSDSNGQPPASPQQYSAVIERYRDGAITTLPTAPVASTPFTVMADPSSRPEVFYPGVAMYRLNEPAR